MRALLRFNAGSAFIFTSDTNEFVCVPNLACVAARRADEDKVSSPVTAGEFLVCCGDSRKEIARFHVKRHPRQLHRQFRKFPVRPSPA